MQTKQQMSRRQFLTLAGSTGAAMALLAACPAPAPAPAGEGGGAAGGSADPITLEFLAWGDIADNPAWETLTDMFLENNEGVEVKINGVADPGNNFYTKLQTMIAGGTPPHVSSFQGWEWQTYADRELLAPVDDYIEADGLTGPYPEGVNTIEVSTKRNGKRYLIPLQMATMVMFYARKPFDEAGIDYPTDDWTMDDFLEIAGKLTDTSGDNKMYGLEANGNWVRDIAYIRGTGEQEFDELVDPKVSQFNQPAIAEMVQLMASDVYHKLGISPTEADLSGGANTIDTGNAAMKYEGAWYFGRLNSPELREEGKEVEFDVVRMPAAADGNRPHRGWSEGLAVNMTDQVEMAWAYASSMAAEEGNKVFSEMTGRLPNSFDLVESFWIPTIEEKFGVKNGMAFVEAFKQSEVDVIGGVTRTQMWSEVVKPVAWDKLTAGDATAEEVLPLVDEGVQAMLDEYWANA